jgi:hypothetical protein
MFYHKRFKTNVKFFYDELMIFWKSLPNCFTKKFKVFTTGGPWGAALLKSKNTLIFLRCVYMGAD